MFLFEYLKVPDPHPQNAPSPPLSPHYRWHPASPKFTHQNLTDDDDDEDDEDDDDEIGAPKYLGRINSARVLGHVSPR